MVEQQVSQGVSAKMIGAFNTVYSFFSMLGVFLVSFFIWISFNIQI